MTSGMWAYTPDRGHAYLQELKAALDSRPTPCRLTVRLSVSEGHDLKLKGKPLVNLINLFEQYYSDEKYFTLQVKTFEGDNALEHHLSDHFSGYTIEPMGENLSDDKNIIKVMPWKSRIRLRSGFNLVCGKSRVFNPGLRPNMNDEDSISDTIKTFDLDVEQSQRFFPAIAFDSEGRKGFDWIVEYNGNVCTWQNRVIDNQFNVYEDSYKSVVEGSMSDLVSRSYIEKGAIYRDAIISEISPKTVALMKAVSVRDYAGNMLFQDEKIRLYYNIRALQDYLSEGKININELHKLSPELQKVIQLPKDELILSYRASTYSIVDQEIARAPTAKHFRDFLELLKLGHFEVSKQNIDKAIEHYKALSGDSISSLEEVTHEQGFAIERRLTDRVIQIKSMNTK